MFLSIWIFLKGAFQIRAYISTVFGSFVTLMGSVGASEGSRFLHFCRSWHLKGCFGVTSKAYMYLRLSNVPLRCQPDNGLGLNCSWLHRDLFGVREGFKQANKSSFSAIFTTFRLFLCNYNSHQVLNVVFNQYIGFRLGHQFNQPFLMISALAELTFKVINM